jgi:hypothetical protein
MSCIPREAACDEPIIAAAGIPRVVFSRTLNLRAAFKTCASMASFPMIARSNGAANANSTAPKPAPT